jgi:alpha-amylase/alpha-mannosidase (GH57 family)
MEPAPRYVCIHGHFYQPPRENPWLETVEVQDSAAPYHDWNDRITAECYAPNGASRITDTENKIIRIVNNYARMSFNFGPTLLSWLNDKAPRTYRMILDADTASAARYGGHGSAIAQVYNHIIMPLANERDAITQIRWGIADFEHRFGRKPEGMWLAETAVNRAVLDLMAREGIKFTIFAPNQCARVRKLAAWDGTERRDVAAASLDATHPAANPEPWSETPNASVDPTHPYLIQLDEGRSITAFFYDGPGSRAIAFEHLLNSGEQFGQRLLGSFHSSSPADPEPAQLAHVATDGESYGHHHKHGEMALSYAMHWIEDNHHAKLTNYGEFLEKFPPKWEAEIAENTSWSCAHGVERWRSDCGCNGGKAGWNQQWRKPLRDALDYLRDATAPLAEKLAQGLLKDFWAARDAYIAVVLDRSRASVDQFLKAQQARELTPSERIAVLQMMELQRHAQLMYTSCGWFFDEISGIETVQIIAYAGRVIQLASELFGDAGKALEPEFLRVLATAKSNVPDLGDGAEVYRRYVTGMKIVLEQVGAHYAISSIFRNYPEDGELFCFDLHRDSHEVFASGRGRVALGRAQIRSQITEETEEIAFAVLHLGDQNLSAAVKRYTPEDEAPFAEFSADVRTAIRRANLPEIIRLIDRFFAPTPAAEPVAQHVVLDPTQPEPGQPETAPGAVAPGIAHTVIPPPAAVPATPIAYSLTSLFADEQHRILRIILDRTVSEMEDSLRMIYEDHASLLHYLTESGMAAPPALAIAAGFALNGNLRRALEADVFDPDEIEALFLRAAADQIALDTPILSFAASQRMKRAMVKLEAAAAGEISANTALQGALTIATALRTMPLEVNLWQSQNIWNDLLRRSDSDYWQAEWKDGFKKLGEAMNISVDRLVIEEGVSAF